MSTITIYADQIVFNLPDGTKETIEQKAIEENKRKMMDDVMELLEEMTKEK